MNISLTNLFFTLFFCLAGYSGFAQFSLAYKNITIETPVEYQRMVSRKENALPIDSAINVWSRYLMTKNKTLLAERYRKDSALSDLIYNQLTLGISAQYLRFNILAVHPQNTQVYLKTLVYVIDPETSNASVFSVFNNLVRIENNQYVVDYLLDQQVAAYKKVKTPNVLFLFKQPTLQIQQNIKKSVRFVDSLMAVAGIKSVKPFIYLIADPGELEKNHEFFGFEYYMDNTSRYIKECNLILDAGALGYYKHELVHAVLRSGGFELGYFLNEGLASFLSNQTSYDSNIDEQLKACLKAVKDGTLTLQEISNSFVLSTKTPDRSSMYSYQLGWLFYYYLTRQKALDLKEVLNKVNHYDYRRTNDLFDRFDRKDINLEDFYNWLKAYTL